MSKAIFSSVSKDRVMALVAAGKTVEESASHLGANPQVVRAILREAAGTISGRVACRRGHVYAKVGIRSVGMGDGIRRDTCEACYQEKLERNRANKQLAKVSRSRPLECANGHLRAQWWGLRGCRKCASDAAHRRHGSPIPAGGADERTYTWDDYADAVTREFATPQWLRQAPLIKAWLVKHDVKPK